MFNILVVDDDKDINVSLCSYLMRNGYEAHGVSGAEEAYDYMFKGRVDLIISDIMMPEIDGYDFAASIRKSNENIPILFVTARDDFSSKKRGYDIGIDDYMVKPVNLEEMLLRIDALLRRARVAVSKVLDVGKVHIDTEARTVFVDGDEISLSAREFNLVHKLLSNPNKTFSRTQLMDEFWAAEAESTTRTVDVYITRIRSKFSGSDDFEIKT
ncbi:MAG: response regulator transcription factor, partial [Lachnospiraceae bacterium]|nr:response regulator transcription factor [Lachnospiraceae bacterium]